MSSRPFRSLAARVIAAAAIHSTRPALVLRDDSLTYDELMERALRIAAALGASDLGSPPLAGVFGAQSADVYAGILGTTLAGAGYVPLNPAFPPFRTAQMIDAAQLRVVIADARGREQLREVMANVKSSPLFLFPDVDDVTPYQAQHGSHRFVGSPRLTVRAQPIAPDVSPASIAYLMFTSGSTGAPKGVAIAQSNIAHFLDVMSERYTILPDDRFSQMFDLTFDLSLFDLFMSWTHGASLHVVPPEHRLAPVKFIRDRALTIWFSVPSVVGMLRKMRILRPGCLPSLRLSLFCGEPLPVASAAAWAEAAPKSLVENLYGPTELTVACTLFRFEPGSTHEHPENGIVSIGRPYPSTDAAVVDETLARVPDGDAGELCLRGPQTSLGYWRDAERTASAFVSMPWMPAGSDNRWYRTGDRVRVAPSGDLLYLGRLDSQVKVLGHRVEIGEIEHVLRRVSGSGLAVVVPWPRTDSGFSGFVAFLGSSEADPKVLIESMEETLPAYMVPREIRLLDEVPLNANGKVDRQALLHLLESEG